MTHQGDHIVRIFANWAILFSLVSFFNYKGVPPLWATFCHGKSNAKMLTKKLIVPHFG
jgi:hypothetical protein